MRPFIICNLMAGACLLFGSARLFAQPIQVEWIPSDEEGWTLTGGPLQIVGELQPTEEFVMRGGPLEITAALLPVGSADLVGGTDPVAIVTHPMSQTNSIGEMATFAVTISGGPLVSYQWRKAGVAIGISERALGSRSAMLTITGLQATDAASYDVVVASAVNVVTSSVATLTIFTNEPFANFTAGPLPPKAGQPVYFDAGASRHGHLGRTIVSYEWDFDYSGTFMPDASGVNVTFTYPDAGDRTAALRVTDNNVPPRTALTTTALQVEPPFVSGDRDAGFHWPLSSGGGIAKVMVQPDGRLLVCGGLTNGYARLHANGTRDTSFDRGSGALGTVSALALQPDGGIILAGSFHMLNGADRYSVARLQADGNLDAGFNAGWGPLGGVFALALQPDGKILIGGDFGSVNGTNRSLVARLHSNGGLDLSFNPGSIGGGSFRHVRDTTIQPDGKVVIVGAFTTVNGVSRRRIARLESNGALDASFDPGTGANGDVVDVALQADGRILIAGSFSSYNGTNRQQIARLHATGGLDLSFDPAEVWDGSVTCLALQPDGKVLMGGSFLSVAGMARNGVARLTSTGALDPSFVPQSETNAQVFTLALQVDAKILIGGAVIDGGGAWRQYLARLNGDPLSPILLNYQRIGSAMTLSWPNPAFLLQYAPTVAGDYTNLPTATSPHTNLLNSQQGYFRLRAP